jgi:hypothetical protein
MPVNETRVVNVKTEGSCDVYIGRPSIFGNPYDVETYGRSEAVRLYGIYVKNRFNSDPAFRAAVQGLYGKRLGCHCAPQKCHGDILKQLADSVDLTLF